MNIHRSVALLALAAVLVATSQAQQRQSQPAPRIGYVYPAGGQAGSTFHVTVGGQYLDGINKVFISGSGVQATLLENFKPLTYQQFRSLGKTTQELQRKKNKTPEEQKRLAELRKRLMTFNRNANATIAETITFQVTVAPNAIVGDRELRLGSDAALSNPRVFSIGQLPEVSKKVAKFVNEDGFKNQRRGEQEAAPPSLETSMTIPCVINGQVLPGQVDHYRFKAKRGQRLVFATSARELTPYLPDAVPGWFQAVITLYDASGKELAFDDDFRFHPDPVLYYEIPKDGEYVLEIKDSIYRGREDFVYRITVSETPFVTSIFPLGGRAGIETAIEVKGWNLPVNSVTQNKDCKPSVLPVYVAKDGWISNRLPFVVDPSPQCAEQEPNDDKDHAQAIGLPIIINGRIDKPGDSDVFRIKGHAGAEIVAEVQARRLDSPVDSVLRITDATGKQIAYNDDNEDKASGLNTHHADSYIRVKLPATGDYYVYLGDAQRKGGPEYAYRLRISLPQPDFELRVVPSSINVRAGSSVAITAYALRKDGYTGDISLALRKAPEGFKLNGAWIPAGQEQIQLTLTAPQTATKELFSIAIDGRANIGGRLIAREAVPAEDMMQAFAYRHLVPSKELKVAVSSGGKFMARQKFSTKQPVQIGEIAPVKIPAGGTAKVHVGMPLTTFFGKVQLELNEPPDGITIKDVTASRDGTEILLATESDKIKPGLKGNLIVNAFAAAGAPRKAGKGAAQPRVPIGTLPAIPFEVVAR